MRPSNDAYYTSLLAGVAARSTCVRRQVGAIIVDEHQRVLSMGFNGVPRGFPHCDNTMCEHGIINCVYCTDEVDHKVLCQGAEDPKGDTRRCMAVHAEINAMLSCTDLRHAHTMFVSATPCKTCALAIANTSIKRVVCCEIYADDARPILEAAGIEIVLRQP